MYKKIRTIIGLVFFKHLDTATPEGRSLDRYRRAAMAAVTSGTARAINLATLLATVPLLLGYLGSDRYGIYATIVSFTAFLSFTDLGVGIGLQNSLSECHGRGDRDKPSGLISSAMALMVLMGGMLTIGAFFVLPLLPVESLIKTQTAAGRAEILPTLQAIMVAFSFGLPAGLVQRIYLAHQEGFWGDMWQMAGRLLAFGGLVVCVWLRQPLWVLAIVVVGTPFLVMMVGTVTICVRRRHLRPSLRLVSFKMMNRLLHTSLAALICQVAWLIMVNAPGLIIANRLGTDEVTTFSIAQRLLASSGLIFMTVIAPLWPAYGEAFTRKDYAWISKTFRRTVKIGAAIQVPVFVILAIFGQKIIYYWSGKAVHVPWLLLMAVNVYYLVNTWNACCGVALSGMNRMRSQATYSILLSFLCVILGYLLATSLGSQGVMWIMTFCGAFGFALAAGLEMLWVKRRVFSKGGESFGSDGESDRIVETSE